MQSRPRTATMLVVLAAIAAVLGGCGSGDDWSRPHATPKPVGELGSGFLSGEGRPPPESTITPRAGSWDQVRPSKGYRVVLLSAGTDAPTRTLTAAVADWAKAEHVQLRTVAATDPKQYVQSISRAIEMAPDLIISAGNNLVDPLALVTANHLDQQFLVLGAQLAEPTHNVTAADWPGAGFRGEGLGLPEAYDPASFTAERAGRALRAGVAAVLNRLTGIVIRLA